jgi:hypothetical protein
MNEMVIKSWDVIIINHTSEPSKFGNRGKNRQGWGREGSPRMKIADIHV